MKHRYEITSPVFTVVSPLSEITARLYRYMMLCLHMRIMEAHTSKQCATADLTVTMAHVKPQQNNSDFLTSEVETFVFVKVWIWIKSPSDYNLSLHTLMPQRLTLLCVRVCICCPHWAHYIALWFPASRVTEPAPPLPPT